MRLRVVNLVIYDEAQEHERLMRHELVRLARHTRDVTQLFVTMSPHCDVAHQRGDVLYVPGCESYIPGILHKTLEAMEYCVRNLAFDVIVRSNISTVIDFRRLPLHELTDTLVYASAYMWNKGAEKKHARSLHGFTFFPILTPRASAVPHTEFRFRALRLQAASLVIQPALGIPL